ncbi:MAG: hypothetical protein JWP89_3092 [Schlesneria sp.]|nr:hypothetical protein [Schlesneria sp.]
MDFLIYYFAPWDFEHHVSQLFCVVLLTVILVDAKFVGMLSEAIRLVVAPFIVGVLLIEIVQWSPNPSSLLLWLCATSAYYVSIRFHRISSNAARGPWRLALSFVGMWTIYASFTGFVQWLIAFSHQNYSTGEKRGVELGVERFAEWLAVVLMACFMGAFFERNRRFIPRGVVVAAIGIALLVAGYYFNGTGLWQFFWNLMRSS